MPSTSIDNSALQEVIYVKGARMHNLKNVDVKIPRNKLVVITGLSGSGKSSLAFDTLYAEGQRRYVESLSSYARQFMGKLDKPEVDDIKGISPAMAIQQKVSTRNPRSTVGTTTEIYDYLKLLYARIGRTYSPVSGEEVKRDSVTDVVSYISKLPEGTKVFIASPREERESQTQIDWLEGLIKQGFTKVLTNGKVADIQSLIESNDIAAQGLELLIDRIKVVQNDEEHQSRLADSIQTAFFEGHGICYIYTNNDGEKRVFSNQFERDGIEFIEPTPNFFAFNNPLGACPKCEGFGSVMGIDADLVIPNKALSVYDDAIVCWKGEKMSTWKDALMMNASKFDFPIHRPIYDLTEEEYELLWTGNKHFKGLHAFFKKLEEKSYKIQYRVMLSRYRGKTSCDACGGSRLRRDAKYVKVGSEPITALVKMSIANLANWFDALNHKLETHEQQIAKRLLTEIQSRLSYLQEVGLSYLTLNRLSNSLSGGESQRINLATILGSSLVGSMYILDEPSIGLHPRDTERLIGVLQNLKRLGNTVIVVEHEEDIMRAADEIIDLGPEAGVHGGELVFQGNHDDLIHGGKSLTAEYLTGRKEIATPSSRRTWTKSIDIIGARENNLKNIDVSFPLSAMVAVTGVSGSGKTSLVKQIVYPALQKMYGTYNKATGEFKEIRGDYKSIEAVELVDQNPIGKSSRSNPVTYVKAYDEIRALFAALPLSKLRGYKPAYYSFNVDGGRCDQCKGEGEVKVEMQFMADIHLECDACKGKRFKSDVLEVEYRGKSIADILSMTIDEAINFFNEDDAKRAKKIIDKLLPLQDVGLGYVQLGQASSTLSGGEAQRIKLASFLSKGKSQAKTLFIFDEPTTGLHFHDINKLLTAFNALIEQGHSLIVIEHNVEVIKNSDWVIDLGPEGGAAGGELVFAGTPEDLINSKASVTGRFLTPKLS